jgi:hypothetical protein
MADQDRDERFVIEGDPEDALRGHLKVDPDSADQSMPALEQELSDCKRDVEGNKEVLSTALEDARRRGVAPATDRDVRVVRENVGRAEANLREAERAYRAALGDG